MDVFKNRMHPTCCGPSEPSAVNLPLYENNPINNSTSKYNPERPNVKIAKIPVRIAPQPLMGCIPGLGASRRININKPEKAINKPTIEKANMSIGRSDEKFLSIIIIENKITAPIPAGNKVGIEFI